MHISTVFVSAQVTKALRTAIMSKQFGNEDFLAKLVASACISILPEKTTFNVDNVRICKILGSGIHKSEVVQVCNVQWVIAFDWLILNFHKYWNSLLVVFHTFNFRITVLHFFIKL